VSGQLSRFTAVDERVHASDPNVVSWNESWFFSWIDLDGGPAGFFRVGVLPNQQRAMLWNFAYVDGAWLGLEESHLASDDFDVSQGLAYDKRGLSLAWQPDPPLLGARFRFNGTVLRRSGSKAGLHARLALDLDSRASGPPEGTGDGKEGEGCSRPTDRFEQSLQASGTLDVDGVVRSIRAGAHRDRSWGPREWRLQFTIGDVQGEDRELYFVGSPAYGLGVGYLREGSEPVRQLAWVGGSVEYDDTTGTIQPGNLAFDDPDGRRIEIAIAPITKGVAFDMAHTCEEPEQWLYWRTLIEARVPGWDGSHRGWFEANRYGSR
jgi:hypothetical protein